MDMVRFPEIEVELVGQDGNAYAILGRVKREMTRHGVSDEDRAEFMTEATSGDYDALLRTVMQWVNVA